MKYENLVDMHTHSDNSFDGHQSCMLLCEKAVEKGAAGIAITDHCEIDSKKEDFRALCTNQFVETFECKRYFEGRLLVMQGLELGQSIYNKELSERILSKYSYDFILGSIHNLRDRQDFFFMTYDTPEEEPISLLNQYFDALIELCQWGQFDSLAHLTYPLRYITGEHKIQVDMSLFDDKINNIFDLLIKGDKALEINTSGLFTAVNDIVPTKEYIKRFHDMGGEYITVGSDSHFADKVCGGIEQGMTIAKECGYDNVTIFNKREPVLIPIE